mgnify:CR=1 FL=1
MSDVGRELDRIGKIDLDDILVAGLEGAFPAFDELVRRDPAAAAREIAAFAARGAGIRDAVERLQPLSVSLPEDALVRVLAALAATGVAEAAAVVDAFSDLGDADLVPTEALVAAIRSLPERGPLDEAGRTAVELLTAAAERFDWDQIAEVLDAVESPGDRTLWLAEALDRQPWAHPDGLGPVTTMLSATALDLAETHATLVAATVRSRLAAGRSPLGWVRLLGAALPGCGEPTCCRTGRFEDALYRRGIFARAGRAPGIPDAGAP